MPFSKVPQVEGLSKAKLWLILASFGAVVAEVIIYVTNHEQLASSHAQGNSATGYNYQHNLSDAEVNQILLAGHKASSATAVTESGQKQNASATGRQSQHGFEQEELALLAAMQAPLTVNQLKPQGNNPTDNAAGGKVEQAGTAPKIEDSALAKDDQNQVSEKRAFIKAQAKPIISNLQDPLADYVLAMGTKIPAQVDQDINSDLPGQIYGHITRDVYDSRTHSALLLPAGSNLVGIYDSAIAYGQERLLVAWKRVNLPNGQFLDLPGMGGADAQGAGFGDKVDNHYDRIFGATTLISVLAAGAQLAQPQQSDALQSPGIGQTIGQSVGTQIAQTGVQLMNKSLNLQPTLHIRPGFEFTVEVTKDLVFPGKYTGNENKLD